MKINRNFSLLLIGQTLANIGDVLYMVSLISTIFMVTGSAAAASFVPFTITGAMFISSIITPIFIGRVKLKWLLAGSQIGKTGLLLLLGISLAGVNQSNYYWLFLFAGLIAFLDGCANPIRQTLIPHYVTEEELMEANGIAESVTQTIQAIMWFVGSMFLLILTPQQLIWIAGCLFVMASILLSLLENISHQPAETAGTFSQIKEGWILLFHTPVLKKIAWLDFLETIAGTVWIAAILLVFVNEALHVGEQWWGFINGAYFSGLIFGSIYCVKKSSFIEKRIGTIMFAGSFASFAVTLLFSLNSWPVIALVLSVLVGFFGQIKNIPQQTIIQTSVPIEKLSLVYTSLGAIGTGVFGTASLVMGFAADFLGVRSVFYISAFLLAIMSIMVYKNRHIFDKNVTEINN